MLKTYDNSIYILHQTLAYTLFIFSSSNGFTLTVVPYA